MLDLYTLTLGMLIATMHPSYLTNGMMVARVQALGQQANALLRSVSIGPLIDSTVEYRALG